MISISENSDSTAAHNATMSLVTVTGDKGTAEFAVDGDTRAATVLERYTKWLGEIDPKRPVDRFRLVRLDGTGVSPSATVNAGEALRAEKRTTGVKGALLATSRRKRDDDQLRALASLYPETCGRCRAEEAALLKLYRQNDATLSADALLKYVGANTSAAGLLDPVDPPLPRDALPSNVMVSVVTPTTSKRADFHATLYACFRWQTHEPRELVVLDTGPTPSPFFTSAAVAGDRRVRYIHREADMPTPTGAPTGAKRNELVELARGDVIAHFDDDDCYGPTYVSTMLAALTASRASLVKLSSWAWLDAARFMQRRDRDCVAWFDSTIDKRKGVADGYTAAGWHSRKWGYGFSFVYTRAAAAAYRFPSTFLGEDYDFVMRLLHHGEPCLAAADDPDCALVLHVVHNNNSSVVARHRTGPFEDLDRTFQHPLTEILSAMRDAHVFDTDVSTTMRLARSQHSDLLLA